MKLNTEELYLSPNLWLSDNHINHAFKYLRKKFPNFSLYDPIAFQINNKIEDINPIIIITLTNNHWITISNHNKEHEWFIYDSLNDSEFLKDIKKDLKKLCVDGEFLELKKTKCTATERN